MTERNKRSAITAAQSAIQTEHASLGQVKPSQAIVYSNEEIDRQTSHAVSL